MTAVFSHGRLRLYLLKLLAEGPKHGYELIRLLENRFLGLYAPSAGTIYPRLQRMEAEGLVTHTQAGGRKVYEITDAGRAELAHRSGELTELETEIHASVADLSTLASDIERQVSGSVRDIKRELRDAAREARQGTARQPWQSSWTVPPNPTPNPTPRPAPTPAATPAAKEAPPAGSAEDELERVVGQLAGEVSRLARQAGVGDAQLRAATAVLNSALTELRRLLRG